MMKEDSMLKTKTAEDASATFKRSEFLHLILNEIWIMKYFFKNYNPEKSRCENFYRHYSWFSVCLHSKAAHAVLLLQTESKLFQSCTSLFWAANNTEKYYATENAKWKDTN